ncbi:unnamed protein product [Spirodela intermedia]|uniref:Uncharacterized protein n=1 Tax=Spirodela intermedia TaxID=51605 RepID=A0A7I8KQM9_SPIIN|nr:unnamed protein product [Spirodela intermedia]
MCYLGRSCWGSSAAGLDRRNHLSRYQHHVYHEQQSRSFVRTRGALSKPKEVPTRFSDAPSISIPPAVDAGAAAGPSVAGKRGLMSWYLGMLDARPVLTKSITAGLIFTLADLSAQTITAPSDSFDLIRTSRMAGYGMLISGPSLHLWFNFLSRILPKRDVINTLKKIVLGQAVYGPIICTVFFSVNAALQGETASEILSRLKRDLPPTILNGLAYWPMCDFIIFRFVPVRLQPLVSNSFAFIWTIYITYMASLGRAGAVGSAAA